LGGIGGVCPWALGVLNGKILAISPDNGDKNAVAIAKVNTHNLRRINVSRSTKWILMPLYGETIQTLTGFKK
jgi:hypothetical protein